MAFWKDITIEKYERIAALGEMNLSEIDLITATVAVIDGVSVSEVEELPYAVLLMKARGLRFLQDKPIPSVVKCSYTLDGKKYVPTLNPEGLTTAQYIDFQVKAADSPNDLAGLLSVILIPEGHKYNEGYSSDDVRQAIYKFLPIEDALGLSAFFFALWKLSIHRLLKTSRRELRKLKRKGSTPQEKELLKTVERLTETIERAQRYF